MKCTAEHLYQQIGLLDDEDNEQRVNLIKEYILKDLITDTIKSGETILFRMDDRSMLVFTDCTEDGLPGVSIEWFDRDRGIKFLKQLSKSGTSIMNSQQLLDDFNKLTDSVNQYLWMIDIAREARENGNICPFTLALDNDRTLLTFDDIDDHGVLINTLGQSRGTAELLQALHIDAEYA